MSENSIPPVKRELNIWIFSAKDRNRKNKIFVGKKIKK